MRKDVTRAQSDAFKALPRELVNSCQARPLSGQAATKAVISPDRPVVPV